MTLVKGRIGAIDTFRDTFGENNQTPYDVILRVQRDGLKTDDPLRALDLSQLKIGNVIKISNAPNTIGQNLQDMNGYYAIEGFLNEGNSYTYIYLTTGKTQWKAIGDRIIDGSRFEIMAFNNKSIPTSNIPGWNKGVNYAQDWMKQADGKIENCRRIYKWLKNEVIPTANVLIKEVQNVGEFAGIVDDLDWMMWCAEAAYNQCKGLKDSKNPFMGGIGADGVRGNTINKGKDYLQNISDIYKKAAMRMKGVEEAFLSKEKRTIDFMKVSGMEKLWQGTKTLTLAPLRLIVEIALTYNVKGFGTAAYELKKQKPAKYEEFRTKWLQIGGNQTKFDAYVQKGGTRKAKMNFVSFYADGTTPENTEYTGEYIKLLVGIGTGIAALVETILAIPPASPAAVAALPYTASGAAVIDGMALIVNSAKIKKPKKPADETSTPDDIKDLPPPDTSGSGVSAFYQNNKGLVWGTIGILTVGTLAVIFRKKLFKSK